jgi:hypothetical protein
VTSRPRWRDFTYAMRMVRVAVDDLIKIGGSSGLRETELLVASGRSMVSCLCPC